MVASFSQLKQSKTRMQKNSTHLIDLIRAYKKDPGKYGTELTETIDKIIYTAANLEGYKPYRKGREDWCDVVQDLRILLFRRITEKVVCDGCDMAALNKRAYNYLKITARLEIRCKLRHIYDRIKCEDKATVVMCRRGDFTQPSVDALREEPFPGVVFADENDKTIADLLSKGYNQRSICTLTGMSAWSVHMSVVRIKEALKEALVNDDNV